MAEIRREVRTLEVAMRCKACDLGEMFSTGITLMSNPPQYPHKCRACGAEETLLRRYPYIANEPVPSGAPASDRHYAVGDDIAAIRSARIAGVAPTADYCATDGTCSCRKFAVDPTNCGRRKELTAGVLASGAQSTHQGADDGRSIGDYHDQQHAAGGRLGGGAGLGCDGALSAGAAGDGTVGPTDSQTLAGTTRSTPADGGGEARGSCCGEDRSLREEPAAAQAVSLLPRIYAAIKRIVNGQGCMRIPADLEDHDLVLADCKRLLRHVSGVSVVDSETLQPAHVICCNDAVMHVHLGDEDSAREKLEELALADYSRNHWTWDYQSRTYGVGKTKDDGYAYYRERCYWHINTAPVTT